MSLNDDVNNEFTETPPGVTVPAEIPQAMDEPVIVESTTSGDDLAELEEVDAIDIILKTTIDGVDQYDKLADVSKTILAAESISRSDVVSLFAAMDSEEFAQRFTDSTSSINGFTSTSTKTNLAEAQSFLEAELNTQRENLKIASVEAVSKARVHAIERINRLDEEIPNLSARLRELIRVASSDFSIAQQSKSALFYVAEKTTTVKDGVEVDKIEKVLYDIRTISLTSYPARYGTVINGSDGELWCELHALSTELLQTVKLAVIRNNYRESSKDSITRAWFSPESLHQERSNESCDSYYDFLSLLTSNVLLMQLENIQQTASVVKAELEEDKDHSLKALSSLSADIRQAMSFVRKTETLVNLASPALSIFRTILTQ